MPLTTTDTATMPCNGAHLQEMTLPPPNHPVAPILQHATTASPVAATADMSKTANNKQGHGLTVRTTPQRPVLPDLSPQFLERLEQKQSLQFATNDECTSLAMTPSGRFVVGGFSDGTLRLFDVTHRFRTGQGLGRQTNKKQEPIGVFQDDESTSDVYKTHRYSAADGFTNSTGTTNTSSSSSGIYVCSHNHQQFGAVAGQIHARGVHTSLRMQVGITPDGLYCFAGVTRGSMELLVVDLGPLEDAATPSTTNSSLATENLLDYVSVHRHADAKLRGFGACTELLRQQNDVAADSCNNKKYLLLCGKGIKNIHVWSFKPPTDAQSEPTFELIYNCVTNGNSISFLYFRHAGPNQLLALSKSQQQKLRVWDLSHEVLPLDDATKAQERPSRPPFTDVVNTEATLGVAGGFCLCGGSDYHFNQVSIVSLEDVKSTYNHTELALPGITAQASFGRRQQRGDLKSVEAVAGMTMDGGHALLELNDRTMVQYTHQGGGCAPVLEMVHDSDLPEGWSRTMAVEKIGSGGLAMAAVAIHNPYTGRGTISLWPMESIATLDQTGSRGGSASLSAISNPDRLQKLKHGAARLEPTEGIAATTAREPAASSSGESDDEESIDGFSTMRDLTNEASTAKHGTSSKLSSARTIGRVSLDPSDEVPMMRRFPPALPTFKGTSNISPDLRQHSRSIHEESDMGITQELLQSAALLKKVKQTVSRRPSLTEGAFPLPSKKVKRDSSQRTHENDSLLSVSEKPRKKAKRSSSNPSLQHSPIAPKKTFRLLKPGSIKLPRTSEQSTGSLSPVPPRKIKTLELVHSPLLSPKQQQRQFRDEDLQDVIRDKCSEQQKKLLEYLSKFPATSVSARMRQQDGSLVTHDEVQESQRQKLLAEHLAAHERSAKTILRAAYDILESVQRSPYLQSLESARELLRITLVKFRSSLDKQLQVQYLQAQELAAKHTWERQGKDAPCIAVSFPFSSVFDQASASLPELIR